jgi:hypothetical protein
LARRYILLSRCIFLVDKGVAGFDSEFSAIGHRVACIDRDPLEVARGELQEETGLVAEQMTYAGHLFQGYGYATQGYHVFLAQDLRRTAVELDHEEQDLITQQFSPSVLVKMIRDGAIKDATTIAALGLLQLTTPGTASLSGTSRLH